MAARADVLGHELYGQITDRARLRTFMEHHVFAVWDFMCLLKRLQRDLSCVEVPWVPGDGEQARFVNEIVLAEESDVDARGRARSHLELYLDAMDEVGASRGAFDGFLERLRQGRTPEAALRGARAPDGAAAFTRETLGVCRKGRTVEVLAAFVHGREDLIPDMFTRLLEQLGREAYPRLAYYLERHVELDGGAHGPAALRALERAIGGDAARRQLAEAAAEASLQARRALWDAVVAALPVGL